MTSSCSFLTCLFRCTEQKVQLQFHLFVAHPFCFKYLKLQKHFIPLPSVLQGGLIQTTYFKHLPSHGCSACAICGRDHFSFYSPPPPKRFLLSEMRNLTKYPCSATFSSMLTRQILLVLRQPECTHLVVINAANE